MSCRGLVPHPAVYVDQILFLVTKQYIEGIPNIAPIQQEALESISNRLGTRVDSTYLDFTDDEELPDF